MIERRLTPLEQSVLHTLSDGRFHSGQLLGETLGVSRAAIWKALKSLQQYGVTPQAVSGRGYRLPRRLELLHADSLRQHMGEESRELLRGLVLFDVLDSTNAYLVGIGNDGHGLACLTEYQSAGRGRRGRHWVSPFGSNIYLSLRWRFSAGMAHLSGLSLAMAVGVIRALSDVGIDNTAVKWPNDVYAQGRKLAGILLEIAGEAAGPCDVVVGLGLNVDMPPQAAQAIDQPWIDVAALRSGVGRNLLAGRLLHHLLLALARFQLDGLKSFLTEWREKDLLAGRALRLLLPNEELLGIGYGIDSDGALLVDLQGERQRFTYGEVSLRIEEGML